MSHVIALIFHVLLSLWQSVAVHAHLYVLIPLAPVLAFSALPFMSFLIRVPYWITSDLYPSDSTSLASTTSSSLVLFVRRSKQTWNRRTVGCLVVSQCYLHCWSYSLGWVSTLLSVNDDHTLTVIRHLFQCSIVCSSVVIINCDTHYSFSHRSPYFQRCAWIKDHVLCGSCAWVHLKILWGYLDTEWRC